YRMHAAVCVRREARPLVDALEAREVVDAHVRAEGLAAVVAAREEDVPVVVPEVGPRRVDGLVDGGERDAPLVVRPHRQGDGRARVDADRGAELAPA